MLGPAALLLTFDVATEAIPEHDDWHTHEHLPERLSIPGFLRGSRWVAVRGEPRYLVLYEVAELATLTSPAYLERLNHPSAWTAKMMPHYRGMKRGLCTVAGSHGLGMGHLAYIVRFEAGGDREQSLRRWLLEETLPGLPSRRGIGSAHLLESSVAAPMTREQSIRGRDAGVDSALLVMGYEAGALSSVAQDLLGPAQLQSRGAPRAVDGVYRLDYALAQAETGTAVTPA